MLLEIIGQMARARCLDIPYERRAGGDAKGWMFRQTLFDQFERIRVGKARQDRLAIRSAMQRKAFADSRQGDKSLASGNLIDEHRRAARQNREVDGLANIITERTQVRTQQFSDV